MEIAIMPIFVAVIVLALLWYLAVTFIPDPFLLKVVLAVIVVITVLYIISLLYGHGPTITIR